MLSKNKCDKQKEKIVNIILKLKKTYTMIYMTIL
jgi:hypothetical protein